LSVAKSDLIKQLANAYPGFIRSDLTRLVDILLFEIESSLKRNESVEFRGAFSLRPRLQKARFSRNPKTNEKVNTPEKRTILFRMSKEWSKKINEK
tara:strand:- start:189 stop:476 length:288 start_codon:yes stop_codon:yes gene_type:complete